MSDVPTIFISAYRNFSVRYLLYSNILSELKKLNVRIVLFLHDNDVDYYKDRFGDENVHVEPVLYDKAFSILKKNQFSKLFVLIRNYIAAPVEGKMNTTLDVKKYIYKTDLCKNLSGWPYYLFISSIASLGRKSYRFRRMLCSLESKLLPGEFYDHYFEKYKPKMLITSSIGNMIDPYFMRAAKRHGCAVTSILHSWDNPTTKGYRGANPDYLVAWNDLMKWELSNYHDLPEERIFSGGIAHWDAYFDGRFKPGSKKDFMKSKGLSGDKRTILYATSSYLLCRRTFDVVEGLLADMKAGRLTEPCQLMVRLHPVYLQKKRGQEGQVVDEYRERIEKLKKDYGDLVAFTSPLMQLLNDDIDMTIEDVLDMAECLHHADVVLTEYSTLMIEGAIFDCPVINIGLYNFRDTVKPISYIENYLHIKRALGPGAVRTAYSFDELRQYIDDYMRDPSLDRENRKKLVDQELSHNKGRAGKAIADHLYEIIKTL